ncbi:UNVERIFIED_CONTAM: putative ribonuclease H protein [Sesamum radiatum]|uniref:Ribonuclease H protein n=1 Tax=Sesamum radiatum TaxID=300843 RepID=A0AAW2IVL8_SESRA
MAFILPKGIINEMIKRLRTFLWKGTSSSGYPKVAWEVVCRPIEEGGQGIKDIFALNRALMSKHLWAVIQQDRTSIWVDWIFQVRLRDCSIWTVKENKGAWGWRKMLTLRHTLLSHIQFRVGDGTSFLLWHDPWHPLGPLITRFPRGPQMTNTGPLDKISVVMEDRQWNWPMITDIACLEITYMLPPISEGQDRISWKSNNGSFNTSTAYDLFRPPGPKVVWSSLLLGPFKIPKNCFILWLAIMGRLSTLDKPWLQNTDSNCILCPDGVPETHNHLFFTCSFSHRCLTIIQQQIPFLWPHRDWQRGIHWASSRWRGKHVVNAAFRSLLASLVYHIWQERNSRRFQQSSRTPSIVGNLVVEELRQRIISVQLRKSASTLGLYRLWKIPWTVEGLSN